MEKHTSKKLFAGILALSAGFVLASCDPISATPASYNDDIVLNADGSKIDDEQIKKDNLMGKIYDAIATDRNTKVVSDILEEVATNKFGTYGELVAAFNDDGTAKDQTKFDAFANKFAREGDSDSDKAARATEFYKDVRERICEFFYNEITSGSYNDDEGRFDEGKLFMAHYYEFYNLGNKEEALNNQFFVTNEITKKNALDFLKGEYSNAERGYIEEKVYPQILKDKLVEGYVYDNNYSSLGRAYARQVSYIKVSYEDHNIPWKLLKAFGENYVEKAGEKELDFEIVSKALKGFEKIGDLQAVEGETAEEAAKHGIIPLANDSNSLNLLKDTLKDMDFTEGTGNAIHLDDAYTYNNVILVPAGDYYKDTKLGELLVSYEKAIRAENAGRFAIADDKAELDKFTSSGKSKEYGLREKLISLAKEDYTTDGWFVKNGGLSELPSALRDRLFNINVANHFEDNALTTSEAKYVNETVEDNTMGQYETWENGKRLPYMRSIYGRMMLIPAKSQPYSEESHNYIYQDVDGKAFYMVQVLEAPSTPKLNKEQAKSYAKLYEDTFMTERIATQVAKILGTKDSYIKDAYTEILKTYTFEFYETSLYEHFKSEYPDLFEEEE